MDTQNSSIEYHTNSNHSLYELSDYMILAKLGQGSYGRVYLAKNKKTKTLYAIKKLKIENGFHSSTLREVGLLKHLQHPNIVTLHQVLVTDRSIFLVLEHLKASLDVFIRDNPISPLLHKSYMFQLLQAVLFCHNRNVLHRDIKPQNILLHKDIRVIKLSDFGLSRKVDFPLSNLTPTVVTIDYRSPELLVSNGSYGGEIDIWSLGCVFVEMVVKRAPFRANVPMDLWFSWFTQLGVPTNEDFPGANDVFRNMEFTADKDINAIKLMKEMVDPQTYDLINKMLIYSQSKRITASEALHHELFRGFDIAKVPAFNEENVGFPHEHAIPKGPQHLDKSPGDIAKMSMAYVKENIKFFPSENVLLAGNSLIGKKRNSGVLNESIIMQMKRQQLDDDVEN